jgi:hypothetical protein
LSFQRSYVVSGIRHQVSLIPLLAFRDKNGRVAVPQLDCARFARLLGIWVLGKGKKGKDGTVQYASL